MYNVSEIIPLSTLKDRLAERGRDSTEVKISVCIKDDGFVHFVIGKPHGEWLAKTSEGQWGHKRQAIQSTDSERAALELGTG